MWIDHSPLHSSSTAQHTASIVKENAHLYLIINTITIIIIITEALSSSWARHLQDKWHAHLKQYLITIAVITVETLSSSWWARYMQDKCVSDKPHLKQYLSTWISAPLLALTLLQGVLQNCWPASSRSARVAEEGRWKNWYTTKKPAEKEKKRKDYAFCRQFEEKPRIIPGCPGKEACTWDQQE